MTRLLITGAAGFIGTALRKSLTADFELVCVDRTSGGIPAKPPVRHHDLCEDEPLPDADVILHLAAHSQVRPIVERPELAVENLAMSRRVLDHAVNQSAAVVLASSREIYGSIEGADEDAVTLKVANPYGASKIAMEALANAYASCFDLEVTTLRIANAYGPYDMNPRVIPIFVAKSLRGEELVVYGNQKVLDFVWIFDVIEAIEEVVERRSDLAGETINLGSGVGTNLTELAERIVNLVGSSAGYSVQPNRVGEPERFVADIERAQSLLDYEPTSLDDGMVRTVNWYQEHDDAVAEIRSRLA